MNEASTSSNVSENFPDFNIISQKNLPDFRYLLIELRKELDFSSNDLGINYKLLDAAIKKGYPEEEYPHFKQHIIRQSKLVWDLRNQIKKLEQIIDSRFIEQDSKFYPFYQRLVEIETKYS